MLNSGLRGKRTKDSKGIVSVADQFNQQQYLIPTVTSFSITDESYVPLDDEAVDSAGGQTIVINGSGFAPGATVTVGGETISVVTFIDSGRLAFTAPANISGSYTIFVTNSTGGTGILVPGLVYSGVPTFYTAAGSLGTVYETTTIDKLVEASGDEPITFSLSSGSLPDGATLNSDGTITGTSPADSGSTTYSFTIKASDAENQDSLRSFSLTINTDVVTWSSPSSDQVYSVAGGSAIDAVTLSATSAAGYGVQYTANTLPEGLQLSGDTITGTPTSADTIYTQLTATANTTGRSATRTISWLISLGDSNWKYVSLLLNGATSTPTFINDASLNNSQLTVVGDTRPSNFNPYEEGYYSNYFDGGTGSYLTIPSGTPFNMGTSDFSIEMWVNPIAQSTYGCLLTFDAADYPFAIYWGSSVGGGNIMAAAGTTSAWFTNTTAMTFGTTEKNKWSHILLTRSGNNWRCFQDGVLRYYASQAGTVGDSSGNIVIGANGTTIYRTQSYISNLRIIKGSIPTDYQTSSTTTGTSIFTPSTAPLTLTSQGAVGANVSLLTCQDNRFVDKSYNNHTVTKNGVSNISAAHPFSTPTTSAYNTLYSVNFDGSGDYLTTPSSTNFDMGTGDFTIECFAITRGFTGSQYGRGLFALYPFGNYGSRLILRHTNADNRLNMYGASGVTPYLGTSGTSGTTALVVGVWNHITLVRQSGVFRVYINGVQDIVVSNQTAVSLANSNCFDIGRVQEGTVPDWNGIISNFRVIKGTCLYPDGTTFTPPSQLLTAVSGTSLLTCQDATLKDNSPNAFTITSAGQAQPVALSPFTMTTANTTVTNLGSAYFDGTGDYLQTPPTPALAMGTGDFTVEWWYYPIDSGSTRYLLDIYDNNSAGRFLVQQNTDMAIGFYGSSAGTRTVSTANALKTNQWNHIVICRNSGSTRIFSNGVQVNTTYSDSGNYTFTTTNLYFGTQNAAGTGNAYGYCVDLRIIKGTGLYTANFLPPQAPLTPVTNTQLLTCQYNGSANNSSFVDQSGFNNIITRNGNTTQGTFSPYSQNGWSNYFNRSRLNSTLTGKAPGTGSFTYELFFNVTVKDAAIANVAALYSTRGGGTGADGFDVQITTAGAVQIGTSGSTLFTSSNSLVTNGLWYHLAIVRNGTTNWTIYLNGSSIGTISNSTNFTSTDLYLGVFGGATQDWFKGYMSNFRYTRAAVYTGNFTAPVSPLTVLTNTEYLTLQDNRWIDNSPNNFTVTYTPLNGTSTIQAYSPFGGVTSVTKGYSNYFDGNGDYLTFTNASGQGVNFGTGDFTVELWYYMTNNTTNSTYHTFIRQDTATNAFDFGYRPSAGNLSIGSGNVGEVTASVTLSTNTWYHIAASRSGTSLRFFVNGTQVGTTATNSYNFGVTGGTVRIGSNNFNAAYTVYGYLSNLRCTKQALYTGNFTPSVAPLTPVANTSLLTCQSATLIDNSTNNFTLTALGDTKPRTFNPFGTTTTTGVSYSPSVNGGSMYFDGTGDYLRTTNALLAVITGDFTIEGWLYPTTLQSYKPLYTLGTESSGRTSFYLNASGQLAIARYLVGTDITFTGVTATTNQWVHFAFSRTGSTISAFLNGTLAGTATLSGSLGAGTQVSIFTSAATDAYGTGYLSDLRVTYSGLYTSNFYPPIVPATPTITKGTTTYVSNLLLNGTSGGIVDAHGTNNLETVGNTQLASEDPYGGSYYSNYFDGTGDRLTYTGNDAFNFGSSDFTIEAWVNPQSFGNLGVVFFSNFVPNSVRFSLYLSSTGVSVDSGSQMTFSGTTTCTLGTWYHCALVRSGSSFKTFINGVQVSTATFANPYWVTANTNVVVGDYSDDYSTGYGYISNLRVIKGQALYTGNFTPSVTPLTNDTVGSTGAGASSSITGTVSLLTCRSNSFKDDSSNNFTPTVSGNPLVKSMNPFQNNTGKSLYLDGSGDYIANYTGAVNLVDDKFIMQGDFTVEAWVYTSVADTSRLIFTLGNEGTNRFQLFVDTSKRLAYDIYLVGTTTFTLQTLTLGAWNHVALVRSGSTITAYINGLSAGTGSRSGTIGSGPLTIGANGNRNGGYWSGYIKDLRITKGVARTITVPTAPYEVK